MNPNEIDLELNEFGNNNLGANIGDNQGFQARTNFNMNKQESTAKNFEDNSQNHNDLTTLKEQNKRINIDKVGFFKFLIYSTKAEIHINSFKDLLYWISLLEMFLFLLSILLFISSPSNFSIFWAFSTHCARGIIGFIVLFRIPDSHLAIENIESFDSSSIETLQEQMVANYFNVLQENQSRIKPFLIIYFILTLINLILDNIIFFYLLMHWNYQEYSVANIFGLILIVIFFLCNGVYFSWFGSIKLTFPYEMWKPIRLAVLGSLSSIKQIILEKTANAYNKAKNLIKRRNHNESEQREPRYDNNPQSHVIDR